MSGPGVGVDIDRVTARGGVVVEGVQVRRGGPHRPPLGSGRRSPAALAPLQISDLEAGGDVRVTLYHGVGYARPDYLGDIASLLAFLRERYVGRERELARIDEFLAQPAGRYLLVQAPGGFGKSVLVGQLVDRALAGELPGHPALVCCFLRTGGARNTTVAFLQAVNAQLLGLLGLPGGTPPGLVELRAQFSELWSEATQRVTAGHPAAAGRRRPGRDGRRRGDRGRRAPQRRRQRRPRGGLVPPRTRPPRQAVGREHPLRTAAVLDLRAFGEESIRELAASFGLDETIVSPARILA